MIILIKHLQWCNDVISEILVLFSFPSKSLAYINKSLGRMRRLFRAQGQVDKRTRELSCPLVKWMNEKFIKCINIGAQIWTR